MAHHHSYSESCSNTRDYMWWLWILLVGSAAVSGTTQHALCAALAMAHCICHVSSTLHTCTIHWYVVMANWGMHPPTYMNGNMGCSFAGQATCPHAWVTSANGINLNQSINTYCWPVAAPISTLHGMPSVAQLHLGVAGLEGSGCVSKRTSQPTRCHGL